MAGGHLYGRLPPRYTVSRLAITERAELLTATKGREKAGPRPRFSERWQVGIVAGVKYRQKFASVVQRRADSRRGAGPRSLFIKAGNLFI